MAAEFWVNDAGAARQIREVWVNDNGIARQIQEIWANDNGVARMVYQAVTLRLDGSVEYYYGGGSPAEFHLSNDGNVYTRVGSSLTTSYAWINSAALVGNYECRATLTSGTFSSGTTGAWLSCSTTRTWTRGAAAGTTQTATFTLEIRKASTAEVVKTATAISITSDRT